jgi:sec-independent protein translocase protein TatC
MAHDDNDMTRMTLGEHLEELRWRLIYAIIGVAVGMGISLLFGRWIFEQLQWPYVKVMGELGRDVPLQVLGATEGFVIYLKVALIGGLILTAPWVFYQMWMFIGAGLYPRERRPILIAVPFSALLFVAGATFYLYVVSVPLLRFFLEFNDYMGVETQVTLPNHITLMVDMMLAFGIGFQLPIVLAILGATGLVDSRTLSKHRRHMIVAVVIFSALVTSPSPIDQILLAIPMYILFEVGVLLVKLQERKKAVGSRESGVDSRGKNAGQAGP